MFGITIKRENALENVTAEHLEAFSAYTRLEGGLLIWEPFVDDLVELITILE